MSGTHTCPHCKKRFYVSSQGWGYGYGSHYTCSYRCMRAMKKEDEDVTQEQKAEANRLLDAGRTAAEAAREIGVNPQQIYDYRAKQRRAGAEPPAVKEAPAPKPDKPETIDKAEALGILALVVDTVRKLYGID